MNKLLHALPLLLLPFLVKAQNFTMRPVVCNLQMPWEITYGPDNFIWTTEARGYKVSRINPATGGTTVLLDLSNNKNFANYPSVSPQGGLMGMALHPNLLSGKPYVYLAYVFRYDGGTAPTGHFFKTKLVRYTYNAASQTLVNEEVICDTIPGSNDHNGGRMTIANVNGAPYLYYGIGDMGAGQFANASRVHKAQDPSSYEGKILRFNLEPDADANDFEKWIPNDGLNTFGRAVWSIGHRNPQGLVAGANGNLYEAEHGPYSDDELNLISAGRNYGFPLVVGLADGNYNNAAVGEGATVPFIVNEATNAANLGANYRNPLKSFFPNDNATIRQNYQNAVNNTPPVPNYFLSWNSIAPSGIAYYGGNAIPNWQNSILITSLKRRRVYRLQLDAAGSAVTSDTLPLFADMGRFRDLAISPDGTKIYVSCDSEGQTSGPTAGTTIDPPNKGCILEFTYTPTNTCALTNCPENQTFTTGSNSAVVSWAEPSLSNCANGTTLVASIPPGSTFPLGTTTVTYTATDPSNIRTTCSFNVIVTAQTGSYCASKGNLPWTEWIANVQIGSLNNTSQKEGYRYFTETNQTTDLAKGRSYPLSITQGFSWAGDPTNATQQGRAWIDFNKNGIFEDTEIVATFNRNTTTANVLIPTTATLGATRMRISLKTNGLPTACETFDKGEVEDYTVTITDGIIASRPDLEISNLVVPAFGISGQTVNYSFKLRNLGSTTASILSYRTIAWVGSPFQIFDDVAVLLLPFGTGTTIPAGADTTYTSSFTLTTNIPIGNQVLKFIADPYNQVVEDNENNNRIEVNFEVRQAITGNFPDLTLANLTIPTPSVQQGNILDWKVDIKNIGTGNAPANFNVRAYLSTDNILSANDIQNGIIPTGNFAAGFSVPQVSGASTIPTTVPVGQYYLILKVDADNTIVESNENNNVIVSSNIFTVTTPQTGGSYCASKSTLPWEYWVANTRFNTLNNTSDKFKDFATLGYSDYTNLTTIVSKGQSYPLSITPGLSWVGNVPNVYCRVWIDFNNNKTFEANELVLEKTNANPLTQSVLIPPTAVTGAVRMRVALKFGAYPTACETFEKGEVEDYTVNIGGTTAALPDYEVRNLTVTSPVVQNTFLPISFSYINIGQSTNCTTTNGIRYYLSTDAIWSPNDTYLNTASGLNTGPINTSYPVNLNIALPANLLGTYYFIVVLDPDNTCAESNEANNYLAQPFVIQSPATGSADIALSILSTPSVFAKYAPLNFTISAKNNSSQVFTNVKVEFKFPTGTTNGGSVTPSVGSWNEWCAGGIQCFTWTIPTLAANTTATLNVPVYVLNPSSPMVATAKLLSSTPVDNVVANNTATISLNAAPPPARSERKQATQLIPIVVDKISPSPSDGEVTIELESLDNREVRFDFSDAFGKTVKTESRKVERGTNRVLFDVFELPQGIYFVSPSTDRGNNVPTKFVKM